MRRTIDLLVERLDGLVPKVALILGSGLGSLVDEVQDAVRVPYDELPDFARSGVSGHAGELVAGMIAGCPAIVLSGRVHYYEHGNAAAMRPAIEILRALGVETLLLTNSAGSLNEEMKPGSLMLIEDHINFSGSNPLLGEPSDKRFVSLTETYDPELRRTFQAAAASVGQELHSGVYMWFSGPTFETPAEIRMARIVGADAVGMSTVPEAILGRFFRLRVAACSVITNYAAGMTGAELSHDETKEMAPAGGAALARILRAVVADIG